MRGDRNGPHPWPAATVRNAKSLVEIEMAHVGTEFAWSAKSNLRIEIRAVHVDLTTVLMDDLACLDDLRFEDAVGGGVGHHQGRESIAIFVRPFFEIVHVDVPARVASDHDNLKISHCSTRRVSAVG